MEHILATDVPKSDDLYKYSNPLKAQKNVTKYLGKNILLYKSSRPSKKFMVHDNKLNKWVHFGSLDPPYEDYLKHKNKTRQHSYLSRATNIRGDWKYNKYSSNNLSIHILWM